MFKFSKGVGSYVVDRRYDGVGRIRRASGTKDAKTFKSILEMLTTLSQTGRRTILCEIRDGIITPLEAYSYYLEGKLDHLPSAATLKNLDPTFYEWVKTHDVVESTRRNYAAAVKRLIDEVGNPSIHQLPKYLTEYRKHCLTGDKARTFNYTRTALLAFLRDRFGRNSTQWNAVSNVRTLKEKSKRQAPQLSVPEFMSLISKLSEPHAAIAKALAFTGMNDKELRGKWEVKQDRIKIFGTKAKGRVREVPLIGPIEKPTRSNVAFRRALRKVRSDLSPYSFRRSFAHWMDMAGIPRARRRLYMGHGTKDVTDLYERHDVDAYLIEDAKAIKDYMMKATLKDSGVKVIQKGSRL
jgi:integrase